MTFAGLWKAWTDEDGQTLESFTIITTVANELLEPLHDRMPVLVSSDNWAFGSAKRRQPAPNSRPC